MSQETTKDSVQFIKNKSFDPTFQVSMVEAVGYDGSVLRPLAVDATGQLKLDTTILYSTFLKLDQTTPQIISNGPLNIDDKDVFLEDTQLLSWGSDNDYMYAGNPFRMYWSNAEIGNGAVMFDDGAGNPIPINATHYGNGTGLTGIGKLATTNTWAYNNIFSTSVTTPQIYGASTASGTLTLTSTSNATKGKVYLGSSSGLGFNEATGNAWIGAESATYLLNISGGSRNPNQGAIYFRSDQSSATGTLQSQIKSYARYRLKSSATRYTFALDFQPNYTFDTASVVAGGYISAIYCSPQLDFQANSCSGAVIGTTINPLVMFGTATGCTVNSVKGLWFQQPSVTGTGTITDWSAIVVQKHFVATSNYAIKLEENTDSGGTSKYGIYIGNISGAATNNYAILTGTGAVSFGDAVTGQDTIEAINGFIAGGTPAVADNTYTFDATIHTTMAITTKGGIITAIAIS